MMITWQERNALLLLALVAVVVILGAVIIESLGKSTFSTPYTTTSADGTLVMLEGSIDRLVVTKNGEDLILLINGTSVFIPSSPALGASLKKGDRVLLYGIVQTYRGEKEIVVQEAGDVRVVQTPGIAITSSNGPIAIM